LPVLQKISGNTLTTKTRPFAYRKTSMSHTKKKSDQKFYYPEITET